jgi:branched-chain amino acid transport system ATP-binding protein
LKVPESQTREPTTEPLLTVRDLSVQYGAIRALRGISLEVGKGEVVALIGSNGAGKSSTLRAVSGMVRPSKGAVRFRGEDTTSLPSHQLVARGMSHAPEGRGIFHNLSVEENLALGAYLRRDHAAVAKDKDHVLSLFPVLAQRQRQQAGTLSGGEQQMLAIARALMSRPTLLLLDEPSLGLAPQIIERIFSTLRAVNAEGVSLLLVEQNAQIALALAHRGYVLETGEIILSGPGKQLLVDPRVREAYLGMPTETA